MENLVRPAALSALLAGSLLAGCLPGEHTAVVTLVPTPAGAGSALPRLTGTDSTVVLSWVEPDQGGHALRFATYTGDVWSDGGTVALGSEWFVNWADLPSVVPITRDFWAAHWLVRRDDSHYAYDIRAAISMDGGDSWGAPIPLHDDGTATEHGFVSLFPDTLDGRAAVSAVWLDGRNMVTDGGMTLRSTQIDDSGGLHKPALLDDLVCDCCQTDVAISAAGPIVAYRDRTEEEIRDVRVSRLHAGKWEADRTVADDGWKIAGCPVNGPAIAASGNRVAITWYTGAGSQPRILAAFSDDSAVTFGTPIRIADGPVMGRVDVVLLDDEAAAVSWLENVRTNDGVRAEIRVRRVQPDGQTGSPQTIAQTGAGRPSGFPQMLRVGTHLLFAWTDTLETDSRVRTAQLEFSRNAL